MPNHLIGGHMPTGKGLADAVRKGKAIGCSAVQVFTSSPQQWKAKTVTEDQATAFKQACQETGITSVTCHDSYLINLCAINPEIEEKSIAALCDEIIRCDTYGIPSLVSHLGAHMKVGEEAGISKVAENLRKIFSATPETVTILAETTAGQGTCLNHQLDQIQSLLEKVQAHPRLGVCVDTCHVFAAGYPIHTVEGYENFWKEFESKIGLDRLKAIHCNDSAKPFASRLDRHAHLGEGEMGPTTFSLLVNDPRFFEIPILVETPEAETHHEVNIKKLWEWVKA